MAESFDAVLAEMRADAEREVTVGWATRMDRYADRLQAAHEAEVAERDALISKLQDLAECIAERAKAEALRQQQERLAATVRADRAVGLLQRWAAIRHYADLTVLDETDAFLSEQAGEWENGDG